MKPFSRENPPPTEPFLREDNSVDTVEVYHGRCEREGCDRSGTWSMLELRSNGARIRNRGLEIVRGDDCPLLICNNCHQEALAFFAEIRQAKSACENCRFWILKQTTAGTGDCRRSAPKGGQLWATTNRSDWCGEHEREQITVGPASTPRKNRRSSYP